MDGSLKKGLGELGYVIRNASPVVMIITILTTFYASGIYLGLFFFFGFYNPILFAGTAPFLLNLFAAPFRSSTIEINGEERLGFMLVLKAYVYLSAILFVALTIIGFIWLMMNDPIY